MNRLTDFDDRKHLIIKSAPKFWDKNWIYDPFSNPHNPKKTIFNNFKTIVSHYLRLKQKKNSKKSMVEPLLCISLHITSFRWVVVVLIKSIDFSVVHLRLFFHCLFGDDNFTATFLLSFQIYYSYVKCVRIYVDFIFPEKIQLWTHRWVVNLSVVAVCILSKWKKKWNEKSFCMSVAASFSIADNTATYTLKIEHRVLTKTVKVKYIFICCLCPFRTAGSLNFTNLLSFILPLQHCFLFLFNF